MFVMRGYQERFYRLSHKAQFDLEIAYKESDMYISCDKPFSRPFLVEIVKKYYEEIEEYIKNHSQFFFAFSPLDTDEDAPPIIQDMISASKISGIGPFSCVAGAIAWYVGRELMIYCQEVVVENGGDLFLKVNEDKTIGLYLGDRFAPPIFKVKN